MHILLTVHQFFPEYQSGTEVLTFSTARELMRRGHRVTIFTGYPARIALADARRFDQYDFDGIQIHRFHHAYVPMGDQEVVSEVEYNNRLAARYFAGLLAELKPDLVHFFHLSRLGAGLVDAVVQAGIPAYYTPTDFWAVCPTSQLLLPDGNVCAGPTRHGGNCIRHVATITGWRYSSVAKRLPVQAIELGAIAAKAGLRVPYSREVAALSRRTAFNVPRLNALQRIFSPTKLMTEVLLRQGVQPEQIVQSAYGIDVSSFEGAAPLRARDGALRLGFIGTLAPHKGCHVLLSAFLRLPRGSARLKIYGDLTQFPEYVAELRETAPGRDDIEFCGTFPNAQIGKVLEEFDALVVPSVWYENTPLVVYSALAAFRPVIASNFAGIAEVVQDGANGLLFTPRDSADLARRLGELLADSALLPRLSANCRSPKSIASYVDELLACYGQRPQRPTGTLPQPQVLEPIATDDRAAAQNAHGFVAGWAVAGRSEPVSIRVLDAGGRQVALTSRFSVRPDVRDGLSLKCNRVGFLLDLEHSIDRLHAVLEVVCRKGTRHTIPFRKLELGKAVQFGDLMVGWDQEELG
jgi:glycosyltransferase involved in cell wall biosynthesis